MFANSSVYDDSTRHTIQVKGLKFVKKSGIILPQSLFCELSEAGKKTEGAEATRFEN